MRIRLFPNIFAVIYCQAQYKMPYVLRRKTTAHLSCAITALFQRCVPGFHSDAFFLDFYMALLVRPAPATCPSTSPFAVGFGIFSMGMRTIAHPTSDFFILVVVAVVMVVVSSAVSR